jgi:hypothetical protein
MSYFLAKFGPAYATALALPTYNREHSVGTAQARPAGIALAGGGEFDPYGSDPWPATADLIATRGIVVTDTSGGLTAALAPWRALARTTSKLWALCDDGTVVWKQARLMGVKIARRYENRTHVEVVMDFWSGEPNWHGTAHADAPTALTNQSTQLTVTNGGNTPASMTLTVANGAAAPAITYLEVKVLVAALVVCSWRYYGSLAAGKVLSVDAGALSILNDGLADYANLSLNSEHKRNRWLELAAGANAVSIWRTGGNATATAAVAFSDAWS